MDTAVNGPFERAVARFDEIHAEDPRVAQAEGRRVTRSLLYHRRLSYWVERLDPIASEPLRLAARCQHIRRWMIPREDFPPGLTGYKRWRSKLAQLHAAESARILREVGYDDETIERVRNSLIKKGLRRDPEVQLLEDAICLTFLENEFEDFAGKHDSQKMIDIVRKTWAKMSERGRKIALELADGLSEAARKLVEEALIP